MLGFKAFTNRKPDAETKAKHQELIDDFHRKHKELEEAGRRLHETGHHITIEYENPHVVRHHNKGGTHFFNFGLNAKKKVHISKSAIVPDK